MRDLPARLPHQGRYSCHVDRRSGGGKLTDAAPQTDPPVRPLTHFSRILLVRLREIGDVVFTTPAIHALRDTFPDAHISYVVEPVAEAVVRHNPHVDEVIVAERHRGAGGVVAEIGLIQRLREGRYDLAIDFHGGPRASLLTWLSGAPTRIGYEVAGRAWMYTTRVARPRALRPRHSVENQWDLLTALGIAPPDKRRHPVEMAIDAPTVASVAQRLAVAGVTDPDRLVVIHVSAGNPFRRWPISSFAAVAASLLQGDTRNRLVITSGPSDRDAAGRVIEETRALVPPQDRSRILTCGEFTLTELRALSDRASLFIGGDSGPMHIASTSGVPIVGLYGPTLPQRSAPWRDSRFAAEAVEIHGLPCRPCNQRVCEPGDFRCLARIQPDEVVAAARRALGQASGTM